MNGVSNVECRVPSETAHTPGPWGLAAYSAVTVIHDGNGDEIAARSMTRNDESPAAERAQVDLRLMTAAPEMLAALKGVEERLSHHGSIDERNMGLVDVMNAVRAAIARAEGRA